MHEEYAMSPPVEACDALSKGCGRAFIKREVFARQHQKRSNDIENIRFVAVVYHDAANTTYMTFRNSATNRSTDAPHEDLGVERYTFRAARIAVKDVYKKPNL